MPACRHDPYHDGGRVDRCPNATYPLRSGVFPTSAAFYGVLLKPSARRARTSGETPTLPEPTTLADPALTSRGGTGWAVRFAGSMRAPPPTCKHEGGTESVFLPRRSAAVLAAAVVSSFLAVPAPAQALPGCPPQPSFDYSIPEDAGPPAAAPVGGGSSRVVFAALGGDHKAYSADTDIGDQPLRVGPLSCFDGTATDNPAVASVGPDDYVLFVHSPNGRIYERHVTAADPGSWTAVPGALSGSGPAAAYTSDGRVHLFVRGTNGALYYASRLLTGSWSTFRSLGGQLFSVPSVAIRPGGGLAVVVRGPVNKIFGIFSMPEVWSGWTELPGNGLTLSNPTAAWGYESDRLDVFVAGIGGGLYQQTFATGGWTGWRRLDAQLPATARLAAAETPGRAIVYAAAEGVLVEKQYVGDWDDYFLAPYTCSACLPHGAGRPGRGMPPRSLASG